MLKAIIITGIGTLLLSSHSQAILNGVDAAKGDLVAKSVVAIQTEEKLADGTTIYHKASGSVISRRLILTAAHVVFYQMRALDSMSVIFDLAPAWGKFPNREKRIKVEKAVFNPDFYMTTSGPSLGTNNDLAIMRLAEDIPADYEPFAIATAGSHLPVIGEIGTVAGYGTDQDGAPRQGLRLRSVARPILAIDGSTMLDAKKFWFDQSTGGFCNGDSGGPSIFGDGKAAKIYGVVAHVTYDTSGQAFCLTKGAFTNVIPFENWIAHTAAALN